MALNQINKLVWIVETIYKARRISFEDLNYRWIENVELSGGEEMQKRTFHKWKWNIFDTFGLSIECEKSAPYRYYIENMDDMKRGSIENWLLSTYSVSNSLMESKSIKDRILLEDVPSGQEYLEPILEAMKKNRFIHITYYNYWREDTREHYVMPLCVKLFRQRWYMIGRKWPSGSDLVYCLDRIRDFRLSSHIFEYPTDFSPQEYFEGCIGVITGDGCDIQKVRLKVSSGQANYFRDLPLHESQEETEQTEDYSIFEYQLRPTFDFQQEILRNGEDVEVIEPIWLRKEIAGKIKRMWNKYNKEQ
ncbi:WYL domain-containing protein [Bacteroides sp. HF-5092]|uniref:WYL domain-containing protein n=1 Tax=Bacteroides TaxID=816 RepID=UPI0011784AFE|nr:MULTISPECIES: WYL domain-containing protein [Bacteroides]TRX41154.1 WYL domain-containing protein [Bacteroides sp. HF-5092]TRX46271.1 WYL domain-containing protein [Bacteroides sp. HF-5092]